MAKNLREVTKADPCPHCGKPDWCYRLGELSVCKRNAEPASGWQLTHQQDQDGASYYAPNALSKTIRPAQKRIWEYPARDRKSLVRVIRVDDGLGNKPKRWQEHWNGNQWVKGLKGISRADIPIYRYAEVQVAIANGQTIFIAEGEPCADALWSLGVPATTNIGGSLKWKPSDSADLQGAKVVLCPDRDRPGVAHMGAISQDFPTAQWLYAFPTSPFWNNLPASGGWDVADWITSDYLTATDIWEACEPRRVTLPDPGVPNSPPPAEEIYTQKCQAALYSDTAWIAFHGKLYRWTGTHYQVACEAGERGRIAQWCQSTPVPVNRNQWRYSYATATHVNNIWRWLQQCFSISPQEVNPPGLNCRNGVVRLKWDGLEASWDLIPHDSAVVYTYVSDIKFEPEADPADCDRMLGCLDPPQQKLFIQTIAASLDLNTIRRHRGQRIKALLCKGHGNNGKDTLREAVRLLYGIGLSDVTIGDFAAYDQGRKFDLAKLQGAQINWSSENSSADNLDRIQSLKRAITGEELDLERKGVDPRPMRLAAVFLFNVNEAPNLKAGLEAIQSRWAVLSFNKTYKEGADPSKGEIEADSRLRYDPNFLKQRVCPALLNKMLSAIATLAVEGIDYSCTEQALQDVQQETNHLWAFARDVGLDYQVGGRVYINDLWELLREWYINNGTLEIVTTEKGKEKRVWHEQPRRGDRNVKAANQIKARLAELFPKIKWHKETQDPARKGQIYLSGLQISEAGEAVGEAVGEAITLSQQGSEASEPIGHTPRQILAMMESLPTNGRQELIRLLLAKEGITASLPHYPRTE